MLRALPPPFLAAEHAGEKFGLPKDADEAPAFGPCTRRIRRHNMDPWAVPLPGRPALVLRRNDQDG